MSFLHLFGCRLRFTVPQDGRFADFKFYDISYDQTRYLPVQVGVTVKLRTGIQCGSNVAQSVIETLAVDGCVDAIALHGRSRLVVVFIFLFSILYSYLNNFLINLS